MGASCAPTPPVPPALPSPPRQGPFSARSTPTATSAPRSRRSPPRHRSSTCPSAPTVAPATPPPAYAISSRATATTTATTRICSPCKPHPRLLQPLWEGNTSPVVAVEWCIHLEQSATSDVCTFLIDATLSS